METRYPEGYQHIVEHFPVENLPPSLRGRLDESGYVRVIIEPEPIPDPPLAYGSGDPVHGAPEKVVETMRTLRDA